MSVSALLLAFLGSSAFQGRADSSSGPQELFYSRKKNETKFAVLTNGEPLWSLTVPYGILNARVSASGAVVAYGYDHASSAPGSRIITIIGSTGHVLSSETIQTRGLIGGRRGYPSPKEILVWDSSDACALWIEGFSTHGLADQLWTYRLSDGSRRSIIEPQRKAAAILGEKWEELHNMTGVHAIDDSELALVLLEKWDPRHTDEAGRRTFPAVQSIVTLLDLDGSVLYCEALPVGDTSATPSRIAIDGRVITFDLTHGGPTSPTTFSLVRRLGETSWKRQL
jgi:hypothetical protein